MRYTLLTLMLISLGYSAKAQTSFVEDIGWLRTLADSIEQETDLCDTCIMFPEIRSYFTPGGLLRFRLRYQCDLQTSTTKLYDKDGVVVAACIITPLNNNCPDASEFTGYTFGRDITTIWTCMDGFDCATAPRSLLFPDYEIIIGSDPCAAGLKVLSVSESFEAYLWTRPDGSVNDQAQLNADISGTYQLIVFEESGCADTSVIDINTDIITAPVISGPKTICNDDGTILSLEGYDQYEWSTGDTTASVVVTEAGEISVIVKNAAGCQDMASTVILDERDKSIHIIASSPVIYEGQSLELSIGSEDLLPGSLSDILWTAGTREIPNTTAIQLQIEEAIKVSLSAFSSEGCLVEDELFINPLPVNLDVYIPNAFYPLGNGGNTRFFVQSIEGTIVLERVAVYDRWGSLVFLDTSPILNASDQGWDGYKDGKLLPVGIYIYDVALVYADGTEDHIAGDVLLIY